MAFLAPLRLRFICYFLLLVRIGTDRLARAFARGYFAYVLAMHNEALQDELRRLEREVVEAERRLAEQETLLVELKRQGQDTDKAKAELEMMRDQQRRRQADRLRLLSLLQP